LALATRCAELEEWLAVEQQLGITEPTHVNQVHYSLQARGIEFDRCPGNASTTL